MPDPGDIPIIGPFYSAANSVDRGKIPILGEVEGSINAVVDFAEYGCYPNWTVWVTTLKKPTYNLIILLLDFGIGDLLRGYFRPTHIRGAGTLTRRPTRGKKGSGKTSRAWRKVSQPPELGNSIGQSLPGSKHFQARKVTGAERWFWILDMQTQRFLWYWLVADASEQFITDWTTAIMESEACRKEILGNIYATKDDTTVTFSGGWSAITGWTVHEETPPGIFTPGSGTIVVPAGQKAYCTLTCTTGANFPNVNDGNQIRVGTAFGPVGFQSESPWPVGPDDNPQSTSVTAVIHGPTAVQTLVFPHGTGLNFTGPAELSVTMYNAT